MHTIDWFIVGIVVLSGLLGVIRGFLRETISLVAWLAGLWLAWKFSYLVEPYLGGILTHTTAQVWVARLIILFSVLLIASLIGVILYYFVHHSPFGTIDRSFGGLFGVLRGLVLIGLGVLAGHLLSLDTEAWWRESKLMPVAEFLGEWVRHIVDDVAPSVRDAL